MTNFKIDPDAGGYVETHSRLSESGGARVLTVKEIVGWLKSKLGGNRETRRSDYWLRHPYAFGDTEAGFSPDFEIDYEALERDMDRWIAETFPKDVQP